MLTTSFFVLVFWNLSVLVPCSLQGSLALKHYMLYHLFHCKWAHDLPNEHYAVMKKTLNYGLRLQGTVVYRISCFKIFIIFAAVINQVRKKLILKQAHMQWDFCETQQLHHAHTLLRRKRAYDGHETCRINWLFYIMSVFGLSLWTTIEIWRCNRADFIREDPLPLLI